jgi:predicted HAD superfamily Cof-like phosphohydrolase
MNKMITDVIDFNQRVLKIEPREIGVMVEGEVKATVKALNEEAQEFQDAFEAQDILGQVDALLDGIYFGIGALYKMGLTAAQIEEAFTAVHDCNMHKKLGIVPKRDNPLGDAVKPEGWHGPEEALAHILGM